MRACAAAAVLGIAGFPYYVDPEAWNVLGWIWLASPGAVVATAMTDHSRPFAPILRFAIGGAIAPVVVMLLATAVTWLMGRPVGDPVLVAMLPAAVFLFVAAALLPVGAVWRWLVDWIDP